MKTRLPIRTESFEVRVLLSATSGDANATNDTASRFAETLRAEFNSGLEQLESEVVSKVGELVASRLRIPAESTAEHIRGFVRGVLDSFDIQDQFAEALNGVAAKLKSPIDVGPTLERLGFTVEYSSMTPDQQNDYLRVSKSIVLEIDSATFGVSGLDVFDYFASARRNDQLNGDLAAEPIKIRLDLKMGIDANDGKPDFYLHDSTRLTIDGIAAAGTIRTGDNGIGIGDLLNVKAELGSRLDISELGVRLVTDDPAGKVRLDDLARTQTIDAFINGKLRVDGTLTSDVSAHIPFFPSLDWSANLELGFSSSGVSTKSSVELPDASAALESFLGKITQEVLGQNVLKDFNPLSIGDVSNLLTKELPVVKTSLAKELGLGDSPLLKLGDAVSALTSPVREAETWLRDNLGITFFGVNDPRLSQAKRFEAYADRLQAFVRGEKVDLVAFESRGSAGWNKNVSFPIAAGALPTPIPITVELSAELGAGIGFSYAVGLGVDTTGFYFSQDTRIGLSGSVRAGINAQAKLLGLAGVELSAGLQASLFAGIGLTDPDPSDGKIYLDEIYNKNDGVSLAKSILNAMEIYASAELSGYAKAEIDLTLFSITIFDETFHIRTLWETDQPFNLPESKRVWALEDTPNLLPEERAWRDGQGTLHLVGDKNADYVSVAEEGGDVVVSWAGYEAKPFSAIARVEFHGHAGNDRFNAAPTFAIPVSAWGGDGHDVIYGGAGNDSLNGDAGDDRVFGRGGSDTVSGGQHNDVVSGGSHDDVLYGNDGDDVLTGGSGADRLFGGSGNDLAKGGAGKDTVRGGLGEDDLRGGRDDDLLIGEEDSDIIHGDAGNDRIHGDFADSQSPSQAADESRKDHLYGDDGNDTIHGGEDDDAIHGGADNDRLYGGSGSDVIQGGHGDDTLEGNAGDDKLFGNAGRNHGFGGSGDDSYYVDITQTGVEDRFEGGVDQDYLILAGTQFDDTLSLRQLEPGVFAYESVYVDADSDESVRGTGSIRFEHSRESDVERLGIHGFSGNDTITVDASVGIRTYIYGGEGADSIQGGSGDDVIYADVPDGQNTETAVSSIDVIRGGAGDDEIHGTERADSLYGGAGNDVIYGKDGDDYINGGEGRDVLRGGNDSDRIFAGDGIWGDIIYGDNGDDVLVGGEGVDVIQGGSANDLIFGGDGIADILSGGDGRDTIVGEGGADFINGGGDDDTLYSGINRELRSQHALPEVPNASSMLEADALYDELFSQELSLYQQRQTTRPDTAERRSIDNMLASVNALQIGLLDQDLLVDTIDGDEGKDTIHGSPGPDFITGGADDDVVYHSQSTQDVVQGGPGIDRYVISGTPEDDHLYIRQTDGNAFVTFERDEATDSKSYASQIEFEILGVELLAGDDRLEVDLGRQATMLLDIDGGDGDDYVDASSFEGRSTIRGGQGDDTLIGGQSQDVIFGGPGNDALASNMGDDTIDGNAGNDTLWERVSADRYVLRESTAVGLGNDTFQNIEHAKIEGDDNPNEINASNGSIPVTIHGHGGNDLLLGGRLDDVLRGGDGNDTLEGRDGRDTLYGEAHDDLLLGGTGDDTLAGGNGNDFLRGFSGNDLLLGGVGEDILAPGAGADHVATSDGADVILSIEQNGDVDSFQIDTADSVYMLTSDGNLIRRTAARSEVIADNVIRIEVAPDGRVYALNSNQTVIRDGVGVWGGVVDFRINADGQVYFLTWSGGLERSTPTGWESLDSNVRKFDISPSGDVVWLRNDEVLRVHGGRKWSGIRDFEIATTGEIFFRVWNGHLETSNGRFIDRNVRKFQLTGDDRAVSHRFDGTVAISGRTVWGGVRDMSVDATGAVSLMGSDGRVDRQTRTGWEYIGHGGHLGRDGHRRVLLDRRAIPATATVNITH